MQSVEPAGALLLGRGALCDEKVFRKKSTCLQKERRWGRKPHETNREGMDWKMGRIPILSGAILRSREILCKNKAPPQAKVNCTPFVRQYDILDNKWGALLCQKGYQTNDTHQNSKSW